MAYNPYGNQSNYQDNWAQQGPQAQTGGLRSAPQNGYSDVNTTYLPRQQNNASPYAMSSGYNGTNLSDSSGNYNWNSSPNYGASMPQTRSTAPAAPRR